ncbi:translesion error-prone DNA polymerase V subunit UmuC [Desulfuromonas acetoxidans]|uniref:DNA-directed DNA polymerase n=1 Tax=Desulfuromonas acetoxidans (strain DSM 684 / 11070) TaxID=281689 RepID=Q1K1Q5_DESA6|nr:translesion error-prone DNA polymerase V subunit UmuC [Desulfuromonas acetoxidans]EAT16333.1 DNA-directed DNA polymerase [Desulfuromonas acetoxidans DSM 684]MBF0645990.1 translesion error-prone DNA polymerase V subunit UmuC [Desulfuromonas acetoxidans]NVD23472.1 translesion error-prone DNA polymerase V subunit UmuC [Desulfuromonas acetoxidans]NVE16142.1 translesion error-prone DNA polymerase V subunit UmuC [Desulfuromonas acetoxidans]
MTSYALVDCNNFYVSCERLFCPQLKRRPVVILSNNDGCVVSRSQEAKALKIPMATPLFKVHSLLKRHQVAIFSSNYTLYADISSRVMQTLELFSPEVEEYSIDEAFLNLTGLVKSEDRLDYGQKIRQTVHQHVGIPVCVGLAPTKTLAKLANYAAKNYPATNGVVDLHSPQRRQRLLHLTPVGEIWGIGRRTALRLQQMGIHTGWQLTQMPLKQARHRFSIVMERLIRELHGENCLEVDHQPAPQQQVICSRSFGEKIVSFDELRETVCEFSARAAEKLRHNQQAARLINVSIRTSAYCAAEPCYANSASGMLQQHTSDSRQIVAKATQLLEGLWKEGYRYAKAGVMLSDLCLENNIQPGLFDDVNQKNKSKALMQAMDHINEQCGSIWLGGQRPQRDWFMNQNYLSPAYTTRWDCLPVVS